MKSSEVQNTNKCSLTNLLLILILIIAASLRLYGITSSYWLDEVLLHKRASQPFNEVLGNTLYPLANILAHFCLKLGDEEFLLRLPNFMAGMITIVAIYHICAKEATRITGLLAAALITISAYHIEYSQDARYYAIMMLFGVLLLTTLLDFVRKPGLINGLIAAVIAALGITNQLVFIPYVLGAFASTALILFIQSDKSIKSKLSSTLLLAATGFLAFIPLLLISQYYHILHPLSSNLMAVGNENPQNATRLPLPQYFSFFWDYRQGYFAFYPLTIKAIFFALAALGAASLWKINRAFFIILIGTLILNPLPSLLLKTSSPYYARYFACQLPILIILISTGLTWFISKARPISKNQQSNAKHQSWCYSILYPAITLAVTLSIVTIGAYPGLKHYYTWGIEDMNWKGFASRMAMDMTSHDVIIYVCPSTSPKTWKYLYKDPLDFYLNRHNIPGTPVNTPGKSIGVSNSTQLTATVKKALNTFPRSTIWMISSNSNLKQLSKPLQSLFSETVSSPKLDLRVLGKPTTNTLQNCDFNNPQVIEKVLKSKGVSIVTGADSLDQSSVLFESPTPGHSYAGFPIMMDSASTQTSSLNQFSNTDNVYTLSLWVKTENIVENKWPASTARLAVTGLDTSGTKVWKDLMWWKGTSDWNRYAFRLESDNEVNPAKLNDPTLFIGIYGGSGKMFVADIQLESGPSPTPYTPGIRLPHDEALLNLNPSFSFDDKPASGPQK